MPLRESGVTSSVSYGYYISDVVCDFSRFVSFLNLVPKPNPAKSAIFPEIDRYCDIHVLCLLCGRYPRKKSRAKSCEFPCCETLCDPESSTDQRCKGPPNIVKILIY